MRGTLFAVVAGAIAFLIGFFDYKRPWRDLNELQFDSDSPLRLFAITAVVVGMIFLVSPRRTIDVANATRAKPTRNPVKLSRYGVASRTKLKVGKCYICTECHEVQIVDTLPHCRICEAPLEPAEYLPPLDDMQDQEKEIGEGQSMGREQQQ